MFGRSSHNGLLSAGLSAVLLTVPFNKLLVFAAKAQACLAFARLLATFAFSDGLPFAINNHRRVSRILSRTMVMSRKTGTVKEHNLNPGDFWIK